MRLLVSRFLLCQRFEKDDMTEKRKKKRHQTPHKMSEFVFYRKEERISNLSPPQKKTENKTKEKPYKD